MTINHSTASFRCLIINETTLITHKFTLFLAGSLCSIFLSQISGMIMGIGFWETLVYWDQTSLFYVNQVWQNGLFDAVLPWLRESIFWAPFYLFLITLVLHNFGKKGGYWILFFILTVAITDQLSSNLLKNSIERIRPCNDPLMIEFIKLRVRQCSGGFSFTSSHAANHFGMAMFIFLTLKNNIGKKTRWIFLWAFAISYAQMYVGVHYPLDILGGTLVGLLGGYFTATIFNRRHTLPQLASSF